MSPPDPRSATVDEAACVVHVDGQRRPFSIDLATGAVTLGSGAGATTIEPLTWREKLTLARFVRAESRLLDSALIAHKLMGDDDSPVAESAEGRALVAVARWVNGFGPDGGAAPLEPRLLARIGDRARQAGELSPAELDRMPAVDVELLAEALATGDARSESGREDDDGVTRIVVMPDPQAGEPDFDDQVGAAAVPTAAVPRSDDLPYLGPAPLPVGRSAPGSPGPAGAGGADRPPPDRRPDPGLRPMPTETGPVPGRPPAGRGDGTYLGPAPLPVGRPAPPPARRPDPGLHPTTSETGPVPGRPPAGGGDGNALRPRPIDGEGSPPPDGSAGPGSEPAWWSPDATTPSRPDSPGDPVARSAVVPAGRHGASGGLAAGPRGPRVAHPRRATAPVLPVLPPLPVPNPIAGQPTDPITVPAPPVSFTAPAAPGARPAPAGAEIDRVLDELANRLEQAVEDLGLDGEG